MKVKLLFGLGLFFMAVGVSYNAKDFFYSISPSGDRGAWFVKRCYDLRGKFTYDNLRTLGGEIAMTELESDGTSTTGYYPFGNEDFSQYMKGNFINYKREGGSEAKDTKMIRTYDESGSIRFTQYGSVKGEWQCLIVPDKIKDTIVTTSADFVPVE